MGAMGPSGIAGVVGAVGMAGPTGATGPTGSSGSTRFVQYEYPIYRVLNCQLLYDCIRFCFQYELIDQLTMYEKRLIEYCKPPTGSNSPQFHTLNSEYRILIAADLGFYFWVLGISQVHKMKNLEKEALEFLKTNTDKLDDYFVRCKQISGHKKLIDSEHVKSVVKDIINIEITKQTGKTEELKKLAKNITDN
jgi:hypothetical protein